MPISIVTTVAAANANSYASVAEVDTYAADAWPRDVTWDAADPEDQKRALVEAARLLDRYRFAGDRATTTQALQWPRAGVRKHLDADLQDEYSTGEVPEPVKRAQATLARFLVSQAAAGVADPFAEDGTAGVSSLSLGGELSVSWDTTKTGATAGVSFLARVVRPILGHLAYTPQPRMVRG